MIDDVLKDADHKMDQTVAHTTQEFGGIRTGRANPGLLNRITVDYYGTQTHLQQIAGFSVPEARLLVIQPYDKTAIPAIERAIQEADLGLNPSNDGNVIRLAFPSLTEERRKDMIRVVRNEAEGGRIAVRNIRRDSNEFLKMAKKEGDISEDDLFKGQDQVQEITDEFVKQIDEIYKEKEKEIIEF